MGRTIKKHKETEGTGDTYLQERNIKTHKETKENKENKEK